MTESRQERIQTFAFVISALICVIITTCIVTSSLLGNNSTLGRCDIALYDKINPNDAPVASLARLPSVGLIRAEAIIAYRESFREKGSDPRPSRGQPFKDCNDLQKVKGIGPKTAKNISKWLKFEYK